MKRFLAWIAKLRCDHFRSHLVRWHIVHYHENEPSCVEAEYCCPKCGKVNYLYFREAEMREWIETMGDYKRE